MRTLLGLAACLLIAHSVRGQSYTLRVQETTDIVIAGATAAYTTNPTIADVTLTRPGHLSLTGHSSGTTQLVVITAAGPQSSGVTVAAPSLPSSLVPTTNVPIARYDGRYSSGIGRIQNALDLITTSGERRSEFHILHIHHLNDEDSSGTIASIFYRQTTPDRQFTLLDELVDVSSITIRNTQLRGLHLRQGPLELHAGYASATLYDGFFLPSDRRWAGGAGYEIDRGSVRWTPSLYGFFSEEEGTGARRGVVGSVTAEHSRGEAFFLRGDLGISRSIALAAEIQHRNSRNQFRTRLSVKPGDFPTLGLSDVPGEHAEMDWTRQLTSQISFTSRATFDRFDLAALEQTIGSGSFALQYAITPRLSVSSGADYSEVRNPDNSIRTIGLPVRASYEGSDFGLAASYRLLDNSLASSRGDTARLDAHTSRGRFTMSGWAERQRNAPTLDLIFSAEPGLELALFRLGITVRSPDDLARALRDNAALIDLGFITGVNLDLTPRRYYGGLNLGWHGSGPRSDHFRLLTIYGRDEGIRTSRDNLIATLSYSRRVLATTDLYGSYTWWMSSSGIEEQQGTSVDVGLRQQFTGVPRFLQRSGTIRGIVFLDPDISGVTGANTTPLSDILVTLDDTRTATTDSRGEYAFGNVSPGTHTISAQLPSSPPAFFTTSSKAETQVPAHVNFGVVWAAARIDGRVLSDAGFGIPGVVIYASRNGTPISASSDAEGNFVFAVPPGTFRIAVAAGSLPAGYAINAVNEQNVTVGADTPQTVSFEVQALRSVAGRAPGATEVRIESIGRTARVDAAGNFVFRSMPYGEFTVSARTGGRVVSGSVVVPSGPAMIRDVVLGTAVPALAESPAPPGLRPARSRARLTASHIVQAGAFREALNASGLVGQLLSIGEQAFSVSTGTLTRVYVGPFETRREAVAANARLRSAGFEGFVTRR